MPDITTLNRLSEILGVDLNYFSENTQPEATEVQPVETSDKQSDELPSGKQKKKLSWDMSHGNWVDADFSGLKNLREKLSSSNMQRCTFIGSDLSGLLLKSNHIDGCDFSGSDIRSSRIHRTNISNNIFKICLLQETEFLESHIVGCDFSGADLTGVEFESGVFEKSSIENAVWHQTSFIRMHIDDMVFDGEVRDCNFENCTFKKVTFRNATLTNTFFKNKSLKHIQFIDCQADRMTYEFLKSGKADLTGITFLTPKGENE